MTNINDIMPKVDGLKFGLITNSQMTISQFQQVLNTMPLDGKWHELYEFPDEVVVDGISVRRKTSERLT